MSILVHPDKNADDGERAQKAFEGDYTLITFALIVNIYLKEDYIKWC
jgi:hypothetical protein